MAWLWVLRLGLGAQLQMRDVSGQLESRVQLLNIKSSNKVNWVSLAVAHRMAGNYELAWQVMLVLTDAGLMIQCCQSWQLLV